MRADRCIYYVVALLARLYLTGAMQVTWYSNQPFGAASNYHRVHVHHSLSSLWADDRWLMLHFLGNYTAIGGVFSSFSSSRKRPNSQSKCPTLNTWRCFQGNIFSSVPRFTMHVLLCSPAQEVHVCTCIQRNPRHCNFTSKKLNMYQGLTDEASGVRWAQRENVEGEETNPYNESYLALKLHVRSWRFLCYIFSLVLPAVNGAWEQTERPSVEVC